VHYDGLRRFDENDEQESDVVLTSADDVEAVVMDKLDNRMERMLGCLTVRQRQVFNVLTTI
jgi:hypothetical protein